MDSKYAKKSLGGSKEEVDEIQFNSKSRSIRVKPIKIVSNQNSNSQINRFFKELLSKKSINILTAGDDQPVSDGSNHSPFTKAFLDVLNSNKNRDGYLRFSTLANYIKKYVQSVTKDKQKPQYKNESLEDGDFIFKLWNII